jgi:hypothetical protein
MATRAFNPRRAPGWTVSGAEDSGRYERSGRRYRPPVAALVTAVVVASLHMAFLVYMVVGGFLALYRFAFIWPSIAVTVYSFYVTLTDFTCPVTTLEKWLLEKAGRTPYDGSFTAHYLRGTLYPAQFETAIWISAMGIAIASYGFALARRRRRALGADAAGPRRMRAGDENRTRTVSLGS